MQQQSCNRHIKNVHGEVALEISKQRRKEAKKLSKTETLKRQRVADPSDQAVEFDFARDIERGQHVCRHCDKIFVAPEARDRHESEHNKVRKFACGKCGQRFAKIVNKHKHEQRCQITSTANEER